VKYYVAVTDKNWYEQLAQLELAEVNFWRPGRTPLHTLSVGEPFLFKLHSPDDYIVGGGFFLKYSSLPVSLAWEAFGLGNGVRNIGQFLEKIRHYRPSAIYEANPIIGCVILVEPFFFPESRWIPIGADWAKNIVQGKTYDTQTFEGAALWKKVELSLGTEIERKIAEASKTYDRVPLRLHSGSFRVAVTEAYQRRCAISGERTLPVLQVSAIKSFSATGPCIVSNGICLRADIRLLFEQGLLTVMPDLKVEVSRTIKDTYDNGEEYWSLRGRELQVLPRSKADYPSEEFLEWHNENVFIG